MKRSRKKSTATSRPRRTRTKPKPAASAPAAEAPPPARWWRRGGSKIHRHGLFAAHDIPKGTRVIEYVGHRLTKAQGWERAVSWQERAQGTHKGAVYVFELNKRYDIDGNVPWNIARHINHSCEPNCDPEIIRGHIWIVALRDIAAGEELTYDYGYDYDLWDEHPCLCGKPSCLGYIVGKQHRWRLRRLLEKKKMLKKRPSTA